MALVLNEDEMMMRDMAQGFFAEKAPVTALRELRDNRDETGFDRGLWSEMAAQGFAGIVVPEEHGGVDMGYLAAGLVAEQMGRNLTASPFMSTAILAATAFKHGSDELKAAWLPKIAAGESIVALAIDEWKASSGVAITVLSSSSGSSSDGSASAKGASASACGGVT